jgi:hypothetical protein
VPKLQPNITIIIIIDKAENSGITRSASTTIFISNSTKCLPLSIFGHTAISYNQYDNKRGTAREWASAQFGEYDRLRGVILKATIIFSVHSVVFHTLCGSQLKKKKKTQGSEKSLIIVELTNKKDTVRSIEWEKESANERIQCLKDNIYK